MQSQYPYFLDNAYIYEDSGEEAEVNWLHPLYRKHYHQWHLVQKIEGGIDSARELIIQKPNEYDTDYKNRLNISTLDNFIERIIKAMTGEIFRKPFTYEGIKDATMEAFDTISGDMSLEQFSKKLTALAIRDGKAFVIVDAPVEGGQPYLSWVERDQLINWVINEDGWTYKLAVIRELYTEQRGKFGHATKVQYRVLNEDGNVEIWRASGDDSKSNVWELYAEIQTTYDFCPIFALDLGDVPPLYDIATMNVAHLNINSRKDDYLMEGLDPVLTFFGAGTGEDDVDGMGDKPTDPKVVLGIRSAMFIDDTEARAEWLEMSGANYEIAKADLEKKEKAMSERALRLQNESVSNQTATEALIDNTEKQSRLTDIAEEVETAINGALNAWQMMTNSTEFVGEVIVNRDFNSTASDTNMINGVVSLYGAGIVSHKTSLEMLQKSEYIDIEDIDQEVEDAQTDFIPQETVPNEATK